MNWNKITIIGGGNLGSAIAKGLLVNKLIKPSQLTLTRRQVNLLDTFKDQGATVTSDNLEAVKGADMVMLGVKPWQIQDVLAEITPVLSEHTMVVSLAAGVPCEQLALWSNTSLSLFRVMPNTAIEIGESMTFVSSSNATAEQDNLLVDLFNHMGKAMLIPESQMGAATVLASCGIAYALRYVRAATEGGVEIGFNANLALQIVSQTVKGATELLIQKGNHPEVEIDRVTTPGGVTIAGLNEMENQGFSSAIIQGLKKANNK